MNVCSICKHEKRDEIDRAIARGVSLRHIASQFGVGYKSVERHQKCIAEALIAARKEQIYRTARNVHDELEKTFQFVEKVTNACDKWLQDPDNPEEYTLKPRAGDIDVIYKEQTGTDADGKPAYKNKRAALSELLAKVEGGGYLVQSAETTHSDPRKLMLEAIGRFHGVIDQLAKLTGAYQKKQDNQHDKNRKRKILIIAMQMIYRERGEEKSREEIEREIDQSVRNVERVWKEAEARAIEAGFINY